jgi:hypothetical protein
LGERLLSKESEREKEEGCEEAVRYIEAWETYVKTSDDRLRKDFEAFGAFETQTYEDRNGRG